MTIPILNLYYLLSYAWDKLAERERVHVSASDYKTALELLSGVLLSGCSILFKRGLDRSYVERTQLYSGIKGTIDFPASLGSATFRAGKAVCSFDEFEYDVLHNQLLKSTLDRLARTAEVDQSIRRRARECSKQFCKISVIPLCPSDFSRIRLHRNNAIYGFLLSVSRLIVESTSLDEKEGQYHFKSFVEDDMKMRTLFEAFVFNFYRAELPVGYIVSRPAIRWAASAVDGSDMSILPKMRTDVVLRCDHRKIILDAKFYKSTLLTNRWGAYKIDSGHLYQIFAYLKNQEANSSDTLNANCEGVLLYPTVGQKHVDESFMFGRHKIRIATVNLDRPWREIHMRLIEIALPKPSYSAFPGMQ